MKEKTKQFLAVMIVSILCLIALSLIMNAVEEQANKIKTSAKNKCELDCLIFNAEFLEYEFGSNVKNEECWCKKDMPFRIR